MQEAFVFLIYVETRENVFFIKLDFEVWPLDQVMDNLFRNQTQLLQEMCQAFRTF